MTSLRDELAGTTRPNVSYTLPVPARLDEVPPAALTDDGVVGDALQAMKRAGRADLVLQFRGTLAQLRSSLKERGVFEVYVAPANDEGAPMPAMLTVSPFVLPSGVTWDQALVRLARGAEVETAPAEVPLHVFRTDSEFRDDAASVRSEVVTYVAPVGGDERRALVFQYTVLSVDDENAADSRRACCSSGRRSCRRCDGSTPDERHEHVPDPVRPHPLGARPTDYADEQWPDAAAWAEWVADELTRDREHAAATRPTVHDEALAIAGFPAAEHVGARFWFFPVDGEPDGWVDVYLQFRPAGGAVPAAPAAAAELLPPLPDTVIEPAVTELDDTAFDAAVRRMSLVPLGESVLGAGRWACSPRGSGSRWPATGWCCSCRRRRRARAHASSRRHRPAAGGHRPRGARDARRSRGAGVTAAQAGAPLDAGTMAALRDAVAALSPAELREPERVPELALVTAIPDAAATFPTVRETAIRAELAARGIRPEATEPPAPRPGRAHTAWSIIALLLALVAPALIMTGRTGGAALDPAWGRSVGIGMILALVILAVLEPGRTRGGFYRGGSVGGGTFVFFAVLWLAAAAIVVAAGVAGEPAAVVGLVLQLVAAAGAIVLAVVAIRHDRARPQVLGGRAAPTALDVPRELADSPGFRSGVERRLADWRRHTDTVLTVEERARVRAAEPEVARLVADRAAAQGGAPAA